MEYEARRLNEVGVTITIPPSPTPQSLHRKDACSIASKYRIRGFDKRNTPLARLGPFLNSPTYRCMSYYTYWYSNLLSRVPQVTPLMVAAQFGRPKAARILLHAGALETYRDPFRFLTPDHVVGHLVPHVSGRVREPDLEADIHRSLARGPAFRARSWLWPTSGKATAGATVAAAITVAIAAAETGREEYKGNRLLLGKSVTGSFRFRRRRGLGKIIGGKGDGRYVIAATCR